MLSAANEGVKKAFEITLQMEVLVPKYFLVMGAIGAAMLSGYQSNGKKSSFIGFDKVIELNFASRGFECPDCPNHCEVIETIREGEIIARYGSRCGKWN